MADVRKIREHMEVIGADGVHVGTVDRVERGRIKLTLPDSGSHTSHHHYLSAGLVAAVEGNKVRLSANGSAAVLLEEEKGGEPIADDRMWNVRTLGIGAAVLGLATIVAAGLTRRRRKAAA